VSGIPYLNALFASTQDVRLSQGRKLQRLAARAKSSDMPKEMPLEIHLNAFECICAGYPMHRKITRERVRGSLDAMLRAEFAD